MVEQANSRNPSEEIQRLVDMLVSHLGPYRIYLCNSYR